MSASALVQVRIDPALKERASAVLENMGLTVSDAVRILLTRVANEGALPFDFAVDPATHDAWFRAKVREALEDPRPGIEADEVEAHFAKRRAAAVSTALEQAEENDGSQAPRGARPRLAHVRKGKT
ncbi:type II toxin-antitoxin system RelB/DinJ family antitoxin [Paraburkholderia silviterrae]|uniref:Type II toxin-antitoxin system RelB/DinJ family antitoxin n=1 Tax=Paraburkholderia silviterrae TaxID=2528715 RepID=A0A4V2ZYL1_9BURK|nr:type II toxin-antitoxin system RelB/DinJ family antitoxin [Paraburkholderia silviterrae]